MEILMSCYWAHRQYFHLVHDSCWTSELVLESFVCISSSPVHEVYVLVKEVTFSKYTWIWSKLPPWNWERFVFCPLESSQMSHAFVRSILWFGRLITSTPYVFPSTPSHWLNCSRRRSSFLRANPGLIKDFVIRNDGSPPELGSVLLLDYYVLMLVWDSVFTCM